MTDAATYLAGLILPQKWRSLHTVGLERDIARQIARLDIAAVNALARAEGFCPYCGGEGEILRSPSGNANDPRATREPCPECVGGSPEDR